MASGFFPLTNAKIIEMVDVITKCVHARDAEQAIRGLTMLREWLEQDYAIDQLQSLGELNGNDHHIN